MNLIFGQIIVSIVKVKSQKVLSRSVDFWGDGEGKTWRGVDPTPPAEIGLKPGFPIVVTDRWMSLRFFTVIGVSGNHCQSLAVFQGR